MFVIVLCGQRFESIADFADGFDEGGSARVGLDLGSQGRDAAIDTACGDEDFVSPDLVEDIVAGQGPPGS